MSILQTIADAVRDGRLRALTPLPRNVPRIRSMYLAEALHRALNASGLSAADVERFARLEATLADFVTSMTLDPDYIYLLTPTGDRVWEIRSVQPEPSIRVFGFFALKDTFIATNYERRKDLDKFESPLWQWSRRRAKVTWRNIFQPYEPSSETDAKLLITGAIDGQYFKK